MAAPQSHGIISMAIFGVFSVLAALGVASKITFWEFFSGFLWGVMIDLDHFTSWSYLKDVLARIKRGGGLPAKDIKFPLPWFHLWPGFILVWSWGLGFHYFASPSFRFYFPFIFWLVHVVIDRFGELPDYISHCSFLYPFRQKAWIPKFGYPLKPPAEFVIGSTIWMVISFFLLGLLIWK